MSNHISSEEYGRIVLEAANRGVAIAIETHRRMGRSIVVWQNGKVVHIAPKDIPARALPHDAWEAAREKDSGLD